MKNSKTTKQPNTGRFSFMKLSPLFGSVSGLAMILSLVVILTNGFRYGIDFAGGTEVQIKFETQPPVAELRNFLEKQVGNVVVQSLGEDNEVLVRMQMAEGANEKEINEKNNQRIKEVTAAITQEFKLGNDAVRRVDVVGPQVGSELKTKGLLAVVYSLIMILIYIGLRFDFKYAPSAVLCLVHDTLITLGIFSLFGREVNIQILAAVLTIIGYSLNDTIITFDRIRENEVVFKGKAFNFIVDRSINDVLSRTVLTSLTTLVSALALYWFAGGVIEDLAFTFAIGVVVGTYSSIYVASPLVGLTDRFSQNFKTA